MESQPLDRRGIPHLNLFFLRFYLVLFLEHILCFFILLDSLSLCVGFYAFAKTAPLLALKEWSHVDEPFCSTLPLLLAVAQTLMIVQVAFFALSGS